MQKAAQEQFAKQSHRYGRGHVLENIEDVRDAGGEHFLLPQAKVLDAATGGGHTGCIWRVWGMKSRWRTSRSRCCSARRKTAAERGLTVQTRQHSAWSNSPTPMKRLIW